MDQPNSCQVHSFASLIEFWKRNFKIVCKGWFLRPLYGSSWVGCSRTGSSLFNIDIELHISGLICLDIWKLDTSLLNRAPLNPIALSIGKFNRDKSYQTFRCLLRRLSSSTSQSCGQFHQRFTPAFFVRKYLAQLFCTYK
jgi:hypothetical protein